MSERVSTLLHVGPKGGRYVFLLVEWNDFAHGVKEELNRQADAFGLALGAHGTFVEAFDRKVDEVAGQVLEKSWPEDISGRLATDQEPIILIFDREWVAFDPREHPYGIIWVSDFGDNPGAVRPMLQQLAMRTARGDDIIAYLRDIAEKERRTRIVDGVERGAGLLARLASYVEKAPSFRRGR